MVFLLILILKKCVFCVCIQILVLMSLHIFCWNPKLFYFCCLGLPTVCPSMILFRQCTNWCQEGCLHLPLYVLPRHFLLLPFTVFTITVICVCSVCHLKMIFLVCLHSAVERRSGVTGALTWPWCCLISHTVKTWILAPSPPWATRLVRLHQTNSLQMHQWSKSFYSLPQYSHLQFYLSALILFCGSFQGADWCCTLLLLDGPSWSGSLHQEEHQDGSYWLQPQVRNKEKHNHSYGSLHVNHVTKSLTPYFSLPFYHFATNEAIQRTEAYEYAQSLGSQPCSLPNFQVDLVLN